MNLSQYNVPKITNILLEQPESFAKNLPKMRPFKVISNLWLALYIAEGSKSLDGPAIVILPYQTVFPLPSHL